MCDKKLVTFYCYFIGSILQKDLDELSAVFVYATCPDCFWYNPAKVPKASGLKTTNTIAYLRIYFLSVADFTTNNQKLYQFGTAQTQFTEVSREEKEHKNYSFKEKVAIAMKAFKGGHPNKKPVINNDSDDEDTD